MADFLIRFGAYGGESEIADRLRSREGMAELRVAQFAFDWGSAVVQETRGFGYDPLSGRDNAVYFAVGRPRFVGVTHEHEGPQGFTRRWAEWAGSASVHRHYRNLTGLFVLVACSQEEVVLLTDRLGYYAAYVGRDRQGRIRALGTLPDLVAQAAGRAGEIDLVSLGESLVRYTPTFPYTHYREVSELRPGSQHRFEVRCAPCTVMHTQKVLWTPSEPAADHTLKQLREQLTCAVRAAGQELTRGAARVAVTLSGGIDSRTVLSVVPAPQRAAALTFLDHENYEFKVAQRVAAAAGVQHVPVFREREFYARLPQREAALVGLMRTAMHGHGLALVDAKSTEYDLILSGLCCDILLKGWFAPENVRSLMAARLGLPQFLRTRLFPRRHAWADPGLPAGAWALRPGIRAELDQRMTERLSELSTIRPRTAEEWINMYPLNRGYASNYSLCNTRLFPADELYLYRDVLEVARACPLLPKIMQRLTTPVFAALCGPLACIEATKTGLPPNLGWLRTRLRLRLRNLRTHRKANPPPLNGLAPWFAEHSWVYLRVLQLHSPAWAELRSAARNAPGMELLADVLQIDPRRLLAGYDEALSPEFQVAAVQLALGIGAAVPGVASPPDEWLSRTLSASG